MKYLEEEQDDEIKKEKPATAVKSKPKKEKYIVRRFTPEYVYCVNNGNGFKFKNVWKDLKVGDEIMI